jgi:hypothetical protein
MVMNERTPQRNEQRSEPKAPIRLKRPVEDNLQETVIPTINKALIPDGMDYNWKRETYFGKEDKQHMIRMGQYHWQPVPYDRHLGQIATDDPDKKIIRNGGLVLSERPMYLSLEAAEEEHKKANKQVSDRFKSLKIAPEGTFARTVAKAESKHNLSVPDDAGYEKE